MTMVEFAEMRDKQSQQRRRRADGATQAALAIPYLFVQIHRLKGVHNLKICWDCEQ